jgi:Tfp pilus assembly protein PilF
MMSRIEHLEAFVKEDPHDPFNHYALALEYLKVNTKQALVQFENLVKEHPDYLPTYYPFAHLLIEMKQPARGELMFQSGIDQARKAGDVKTLRELQAAYNDWLFLRDDQA